MCDCFQTKMLQIKTGASGVLDKRTVSAVSGKKLHHFRPQLNLNF